MNRMMMAVAVAAMLGGTAKAQDTMQKQDGGMDRSEQLTVMMTKRLKLTDAQVPKVKEINDRFAKEMRALHKERQAAKAEGTATADTATRTKAKDIEQRKDQELKAVLTPEQMAEWHKMQMEMRAQMKAKRQAMQQAPKQQSLQQPAPAQ